MTGTICVQTSHSLSRSYLNHLVLQWIVKKWYESYGLDQSGSVQGQVAGCFKCGDERFGYIKCEEFLDWLRTC
jgi:hypothetical protein